MTKRWRTIDSAPRDGRVVHCYGHGSEHQIEPMKWYPGSAPGEGTWGWLEGDAPRKQPTHWKPLDPIPSKDDTTKEQIDKIVDLIEKLMYLGSDKGAERLTALAASHLNRSRPPEATEVQVVGSSYRYDLDQDWSIWYHAPDLIRNMSVVLREIPSEWRVISFQGPPWTTIITRDDGVGVYGSHDSIPSVSALIAVLRIRIREITEGMIREDKGEA